MKNQSELTNTMGPDAELQYIRKIIADSRASFVEDGMPYIWWGLIVATGMSVNYISVLTQRDLYAGYIWIGLVLFGWGTIIKYMVEKKKQGIKAHSFIDRIQGAIWGTCGGTLGLAVILIVCIQHSGDTPSIHPLYACFVSSLILGIAYFLSGIANDLNWLRNVGFAWWVAAVAMYLWPSVHVLGIYAGMLIVFQVVPGIILQKRYRKLVAVSEEG
jgi:hypothetical protein